MRRRSLVVCAILCACQLLGAVDYQIALVNLGDQTSSFFPVFSSLAQTVLAGQEGPQDQAYRNLLARQSTEQVQWEAVKTAYASENVWEDANKQQDSTPPAQESRPIVVQEVDADEAAKAIFRAGEYRWFCDAYGYDRILFASQQAIGDHLRLVITSYRRATDTTSTLFDGLSFQDDFQDVKGTIALSMVKEVLGFPAGVLVFNDRPVSSLFVSLDGGPQHTAGELMVVPPGSHQITISAYGYQEKNVTVQVDEGAVVTVDASLTQLVVPAISLVSLDGNVQWFVNGEPSGTSSSLLLTDSQLPLLLVARKDGYLASARQLSHPERLLSFELKPSWWGDEKLLSGRQKAFYQSFVALVCSVGLTLMYPTLYGAYGNGSALPEGLHVALEGASAIAGLMLLRTAIVYTGGILAF